MTFDKLGPLLNEERTNEVCHLCQNYIYKRVYMDLNSSDKKKTKIVFVCKNCLNNNNSEN